MRQRTTQPNLGLEHKEYLLLKSLSTPAKIQDFLNELPFDFGPGEEIDRSVRGIIMEGKADCVGGAVLAAAALWIQGRKPLLLDLVSAEPDFDHVVALFQEDGCWGAISKTNHGVLRYREPIYKNVRELALSYFHEYFLRNGVKTLRRYSKPFDASKYGNDWLKDKEAVINLMYELDSSPHEEILTQKQKRKLRKADPIEIKAGEVVEYKEL